MPLCLCVQTNSAIDLLILKRELSFIVFQDEEFCCALRSGDSDTVQQCLQYGLSANFELPVMSALQRIDFPQHNPTAVPITQLLINNALNQDGHSALMKAVHFNHIKVIDILLKAGADVDETIEVID